MKSSKCLYAAAVLALLLILSEFIAFPILRGSTVNTLSAETGNYGGLLQYEWSQFQGDSSFTRFSDGPAPEAPDILWKINITDIQSYLSAFNGMVFVTNSTTVFALDRENGSIIWGTTVPAPGRWPAVYKIDDTHMVIGSSCLEIATGRILWTSANFSANVATFAAGAYSPEEKMFYVKTKSYVQAWNFSDPSIPPTLAWTTYVPGGESVGSGVQYGDGKVFPGSFLSHQMALDAKTGNVLWDTETKGSMIFAGSYCQGMFLKACTYDNTFYCFNATNGAILWTFNPGTSDGYWCSGSAAAYDMVYELSKDGNLYALDINTGKLLWVYQGPGPLFFPGNPIVGDGKIYATTGQRSSFDPSTGNYSKSEFACLDAYTGQVIWKLPIEAYSPRESTAIAYGNLYLIPAYVQYEQMDQYTTLNQVWAIGTRSWPMFRHDAANTGAGQSGPTNLTLRWNFTALGAVTSSPVAADGMVYFGSQDKNVYCVDAWSGSLIWKFNTSDRILSSLAVVNGKVYVGPDDGYVYCLDAYNGSLIWYTYAGGDIQANYNAEVILHSSPIVVGDRVYVGALDNNTYCLDANDGNIVWKYLTKGLITSTPAVSNGVVYVESQEPSSGALYALDATSGALIWNMSLPYVQATRGTDLMSSPAVGDGMIFVASNKQAYYGINATTGKIQWTYKNINASEFIICSPVYTDEKVYLIDEFFIVCVDALNGEPQWQTFLGAELYISPTYADGKLYIITDERGLYVVNATNGEKLSFAATPSNGWSAPTLYEGRLYFGNNDWNVYSFSEYPALNSSITIELVKPKVVLGESVPGFGHLVPCMANASVVVYFVKPDGAVIDMPVVTYEKGAFSFIYTPDVVGNWTVAAVWSSDRGYYASAYSEMATVEVTVAPASSPITTPQKGMPVEYAYAVIVVITIIVVDILVYAYMKRPKSKSKQSLG
jgi:outer membrane protein assembly factor BamB